MAIFGNLEIESLVQENDKTRLSAIKSFVSKDEAAITLVRIKPSASDSFIDVTGSDSEDWFLDWEYGSEATATVELEITTDGAPSTFTKTIDVISEANDLLFSQDSDLIENEDDIMDYLRKGRNSFKDKHRQSQKRIIDTLDRKKIFNEEGKRLEKEDIFGRDEVKQWSTYLTLHIIYKSLIIEPGDNFDSQQSYYANLAAAGESSSVLRFDFDQDGEQDFSSINLGSGSLLRR